MDKLTINDLNTNAHTERHIRLVKVVLEAFTSELRKRGIVHDQSKLELPEVKMFTDNISLLKSLTYGTDAYKQALKNMGPTLKHHYEHNSHHPEHYEDGINDMNLIDVIEMFCDWASATKKHNDGNLADSIAINEKRFNMDPQLVCIFENTIEFVEKAMDGC